MATKIFQISIFLMVFASCNHKQPVAKPISSDFDIYKYRKEALKADCVKINNTVPYSMNKDEFHLIFGKEDSSFNAPKGLFATLGFRDTSSHVCRYLCKGRSVFIQIGHLIYPILLDLPSTPVTLNCDSITLNLNTTNWDIFKYFPMSTLLYKGGEGGAIGGTITIDAVGGNQGDHLWYLDFQGDHLTKIAFYPLPIRPIIDDMEEIRKNFNQRE